MGIEALAADVVARGPSIDGVPLLKRADGKFAVDSSESGTVATSVLAQVAVALNLEKYAEAAIRFAQSGQANPGDVCFKAGFDPSQPRDKNGEWTVSGSEASHITTSVAVVDTYCRIVTQLCIVEATNTLPTKDFGVSFFRALNACMDRHGCLGRA